VRIIDKSKIESIKRAVEEVSGLTNAELEFNRNHTVTPWASLAMYLIYSEGETAANTAKHYGRKHPTVHHVVKKINADPEKYTPHLDRIRERASQCG